VNGIAAMSATGLYGPTRVAAGIIGTADLRLGAGVAGVLDAQIAAGGGRFRGIRRAGAWDADPAVPPHRTNPGPGLFARDDFRAGFAQLAPRRLTFEAWVYHRQIPDVAALARAFPDTTIILNHFGGPLGVGPYAGRADEVYAQWRTSITELARCPNVVAKLGGINMEMNGFGWHEKPRPPGSQELADATRRYYEFTIERSAPSAACSSRTSRWTRPAAATRCCGTRSSAWPRATRRRTRTRSSTTRPRVSTGSTA
jgi:hypothetical protein